MEGFKTVNRPIFFAIHYDNYEYIFEITKACIMDFKNIIFSYFTTNIFSIANFDLWPTFRAAGEQR